MSGKGFIVFLTVQGEPQKEREQMLIASLAIIAGIIGTAIALVQDPIEQERK
jgi:hypothetical protein